MRMLRLLLFVLVTITLSEDAAFAQAIKTVSAHATIDGAGPRDNHPVIPSPKAQEPCSGLMVLSIQGDYPLQDLGIDASAGEPVTQDMLLVKCGHLAVDVWASAQLSDGTFGHRGPGDEVDLEGAYANTVATPFGTFTYELYAAYFALDLGKGLRKSEDDFVQIYGELGRPFHLGRFQVTPFGRYIHVFAIGDFDDLDFIRVGVRVDVPFSLPLAGTLNGHIEIGHMYNLNAAGVVPHDTVWRGDLGISRDLGHGWSITPGIKVTEFLGVTPLIKLAYSF